jgi:hypothetical protein
MRIPLLYDYLHLAEHVTLSQDLVSWQVIVDCVVSNTAVQLTVAEAPYDELLCSIRVMVQESMSGTLPQSGESRTQICISEIGNKLKGIIIKLLAN